MESISLEKLLGIAGAIFSVHEDELDCEGCDAEMPHLAEIIEAGEDPKKLLPAVVAHLEICHDCREEFEALLAVIRAEHSGAVLDAAHGAE
ncbi:MAG: hypothetical protein JW910_16050 [Anaerolineae bacterium]|nr:hypothetical protein [Anaerolineae bacterium]